MFPMGSELIVLLALPTFGLIGYCLRDLASGRGTARAVTDAGISRGLWIGMLVVGIVIWPFGWIVAAAYLRTRRGVTPSRPR
jgi:hypothetical protein